MKKVVEELKYIRNLLAVVVGILLGVVLGQTIGALGIAYIFDEKCDDWGFVSYHKDYRSCVQIIDNQPVYYPYEVVKAAHDKLEE